MCLKILYDKEKTTKFIEGAANSKGHITVYKIVEINDERYEPPFMFLTQSYKNGLNTALIINNIRIVHKGQDTGKTYRSGFHFYVMKNVAIETMKMMLEEKVFEATYRVIKCIIHKSWITSVGIDVIGEGKAVVTSNANFPSFGDEESIVKEITNQRKEICV